MNDATCTARARDLLFDLQKDGVRLNKDKCKQFALAALALDSVIANDRMGDVSDFDIAVDRDSRAATVSIRSSYFFIDSNRESALKELTCLADNVRFKSHDGLDFSIHFLILDLIEEDK